MTGRDLNGAAWIGLALLSAGAVACGSSGSSGSSDASLPFDAGSADATPSDSSASDATSGDVSASDATTLDALGQDAMPSDTGVGSMDATAALDAAAGGDAGLVGRIVLGQSKVGSANLPGVSAHFGGSAGTQIGVAGGCEVLRFSSTSTSYSAGLITISGGTQPVTLTPSGTAPHVAYAPSQIPIPVFAAGADLTYAAAGADVPQLTGHVRAPSFITANLPASASRSADLALAWTAGTSSYVEVSIFTAGPGAADFVGITCLVPDNGAFTVPAAAMMLIPVDHTSGQIGLARYNETNINAGMWLVHLGAFTAIASPATFTN
jgi:hypothetical protein